MDLSQSFKKNDLAMKSPTNGISSNFSTINNTSKQGSVNFNNIYDKVFSCKSKSPSVSTRTLQTETKSSSCTKDMFEDINQKFSNTKNILFDFKPAVSKEEKHIKSLQMKNNLMRYIPSYTSENKEDKSKTIMKNEFDAFKSKYFTNKEEKVKSHSRAIVSLSSLNTIKKPENSYIFSEKKLSIMTLIKHKPEPTLSHFAKLKNDNNSLFKARNSIDFTKSQSGFSISNKLKTQPILVGIKNSNTKLNNTNLTKSQNAISKLMKDLNI